MRWQCRQFRRRPRVGRGRPESNLTIPPLAAIFSHPKALAHALSGWNLFASRRKLGRTRHQFCAVLSNAEKVSFACSTTRAAASSSASSCRSAPRSLARLSHDVFARPDLRLSRARALWPSWAIVSTPTSCCSILRQAPRGTAVWSDAHFCLSHGSPREDMSFDRRDNSRGMPRRSWWTRPSTGAAARSAQHPLGTDHHL